jgi:hypothetical protein
MLSSSSWTLRFVADTTSDVLEVLRATGPFIAAAVALGIASWSGYRERRRRPELRLLFDPATDDVDPGVGEGKDEKHWVRLRVANRWGKHTAEDVEVFVVHVRPWRAPSLNGFRLRWANTVETDQRWRDVPWPARQTIPPGTARHVDLLDIARSDPERGDPIEGHAEARITLKVLPDRRDKRQSLTEGEWCVLLALTARDVDAVYYRVSITFDGLWWSSEDMREQLQVLVTRVHYIGLEPERAWKQRFAQVSWRRRR